jgi:hypothetical protein
MPCLCGAPLVTVMETADLGNGDNCSWRCRLDRSAIGRVLLQSERRDFCGNTQCSWPSRAGDGAR